jgi:hypothetical protein
MKKKIKKPVGSTHMGSVGPPLPVGRRATGCSVVFRQQLPHACVYCPASTRTTHVTNYDNRLSFAVPITDCGPMYLGAILGSVTPVNYAP